MHHSVKCGSYICLFDNLCRISFTFVSLEIFFQHKNYKRTFNNGFFFKKNSYFSLHSCQNELNNFPAHLSGPGRKHVVVPPAPSSSSPDAVLRASDAPVEHLVEPTRLERGQAKDEQAKRDQLREK